MQDLHGYIDGTGIDAIARAVGVSDGAVRLQRGRGSFPARWFKPMRDAGLNPPEHLFAWATPPAGKPEAAE